MKQVITNYTFSTSAKTVTLTDFGASHPIDLKRLYLITDVTTNKILYNFADSAVQATISSNNVITLSALQGGEANGDSLQVIYEVVIGDPTYETPLLPSGAATAAKQPALGTAGSSSTDVLSVQGIASGTALPVSGTFWQTTQPISGSVSPAPPATPWAGVQTTPITNTTPASIATVSGGASITGKTVYITSLTFSNTSGITTLVQLQATSGGNVLWSGIVPAGGGIVVSLPSPIAMQTTAVVPYFVPVTTAASITASASGFAV